MGDEYPGAGQAPYLDIPHPVLHRRRDRRGLDVLRVLVNFDLVAGGIGHRCNYQLLDVGIVQRPSLLRDQASYGP
jgi:hypothetical protein